MTDENRSLREWAFSLIYKNPPKNPADDECVARLEREIKAQKCRLDAWILAGKPERRRELLPPATTSPET